MAKKATTNGKNITEKVEKKPKVVFVGEYYNYRQKKKDFVTTTTLERLGHELIDWAEATDSEQGIKINQFLALKGISEKNWFDWCTKYEPLKDANAYAKMLIGNRRESGAMIRKFDTGVTNFMMPLYDSAWDAMLKRREDLKKQTEDANKGPAIVLIEKVADCPEVPVKKERHA